ncbi:hypothetical protein CAPN002_17350 [Capnocytophaga stomatis]|uniref:DUF4296 domain-containing protein n=1 Tax=Capnocytophaga stomatis TaxID=1848904 RepID=UPI00194E393F|nr:DUF4296 domain-containing protein [Capnocytophaga stomatis]GIJ94517.1 hypothetical protein CAPN002_17350 [Capnocytophaga stomatis]
MKLKYFYIILTLLLTSCGRNIVSEPKKLLSETEMEGLMYDLAVFDAIKSVDYQLMDTINFNIDEVIYKKHGIDSLSFVENMIYYASFPKKYDSIIKRVDVRLQKERDEFSKKSHQTEKIPSDDEIPVIDSLESINPIN